MIANDYEDHIKHIKIYFGKLQSTSVISGKTDNGKKSQNPRILNLYISQNIEVCAVRICCGKWNNWHSSGSKVLLENLIVPQLLKILK